MDGRAFHSNLPYVSWMGFLPPIGLPSIDGRPHPWTATLLIDNSNHCNYILTTTTFKHLVINASLLVPNSSSGDDLLSINRVAIYG